MSKHAAANPIVPPDELAEIKSRASIARLAGIDAVDAGRGWDEPKNRVMRRSAQDVASLLYYIDKFEKETR